MTPRTDFTMIHRYLRTALTRHVKVFPRLPGEGQGEGGRLHSYIPLGRSAGVSSGGMLAIGFLFDISGKILLQ